jgi:hypothetical protein
MVLKCSAALLLKNKNKTESFRLLLRKKSLFRIHKSHYYQEGGGFSNVPGRIQIGSVTNWPPGSG